MSERRTFGYPIRLDNGEVVKVPLGPYAVTLAALNCLTVLELEDMPDFDPAWIFPEDSTSTKDFHEKLDQLYDLLRERTKDPSILGEGIAISLDLLAYVGILTNRAVGVTVNIWSLSELAEKNEEFKKLIHYKIPNGLSFDQIEEAVKQVADGLATVLSKEDTPYKPLVRSGSAINPSQMGQSFGVVGLKPNLDGGIIPNPVNTSFLRGLRNESDLLTNAMGARKALITNHYQVSNSGYFSRKLTLLALNHRLLNVSDCGVRRGLRVNVSSRGVLNRLAGREHCRRRRG